MYKKVAGEWKIAEHHSSAMPEGSKTKTEIIGGLFDKWNAALQTGNPERVADLYAPDGVLLPTVSNQVRSPSLPGGTRHLGRLQRLPGRCIPIRPCPAALLCPSPRQQPGLATPPPAWPPMPGPSPLPSAAWSPAPRRCAAPAPPSWTTSPSS
jgi:hypothetical protein